MVNQGLSPKAYFICVINEKETIKDLILLTKKVSRQVSASEMETGKSTFVVVCHKQFVTGRLLFGKS